MATRSKAGSRSTAAAKKRELAHRQIWAVVLFAIGILLTTLSFVKGQNFWNTLHDAMFGLFGWCGFLIGPLFIYVSVMIALDKATGSILGNVIESVGLIALICGVTQIFGAGIPEEDGLWENIKTLYASGIAYKGGGLMSAVIGLPLLAMFGKVPAAITVCLLIFVFLMLLTGTTLIQFFYNAYKPVKKMGEAYTQKVSEIRSTPRFNIDVPLDDPAPSRGSKGEKELPPKRREKPNKQPVVQEQEEPENPFEELLPMHPVSSPKGTLDGQQKLLRAKDKLLAAASDKPVEPVKPPIPFPAQEPEPEEDGSLLDKLLINPDPELADDGPVELIRDPEPPEEPAFVEAAADSSPAEEETLPEPPVEKPAKPAPTGPNDKSLQIDDLINKVVADDLAKKEEKEKQIQKLALEGEPEDSRLDSIHDIYAFPPVDLLTQAKMIANDDISDELKANAARLVDTLKSFGVQTRIVDISRGPAVTRYELQPSAGVKISRITSLADDIALNLAAAGVRIEAPIPNKAAVGIEVPNKLVSTVSIREIIDSDQFVKAESRLTAALGKDIAGNVTLADIGKMPHVLIAGATGSGKSVCINSIIISLLFKSSPDEVKLLMVDPKVVELGIYNGIPHLLVPVVTDPRKAAGALNWAVTEMLNRYKMFADNSVRDLKGFNALAQTKEGLNPMPQIVIIIDELADLMMAAPNEVEDAICRLAQMARAAGMHLVIATQRPSVDVITGVIKANIPSRIAFAVSSQVDSRTILDSGGAEKLLGKGDMLFYPVGAAKPLRVQGCFVSDKEVEKVVEFIKQGDEAVYDDQIVEEIEKRAVQEKGKGKGSKDDGGGFEEHDEMLPDAIEIVVEAGQASTSLLQRKLKLGYARAARIVDEMESQGIVGPFEGSKPRQVLISRERWMEMKMNREEE